MPKPACSWEHWEKHWLRPCQGSRSMPCQERNAADLCTVRAIKALLCCSYPANGGSRLRSTGPSAHFAHHQVLAADEPHRPHTCSSCTLPPALLQAEA